MRHWVLWITVAWLATACQTTSGGLTKNHQELVDGFIKITTAACIAGFHPDEDARKVMKALDKTPRDVCDCTLKRFFSEMNDADVSRFVDDIHDYGKQLSGREPWKTRIMTATVGCLAETVTAGATPPAHSRPPRAPGADEI